MGVLLFSLCVSGLGLAAQGFDPDLRASVNYFFPLPDLATQQESPFSYGLGVQGSFGTPLFGFLLPAVNVGDTWLTSKTGDNKTLNVFTIGGQLGFYLNTWDGGRLSLKASH